MGDIKGVRQGARASSVLKTLAATVPLHDYGLARRIEQAAVVPERFFNPLKES